MDLRRLPRALPTPRLRAGVVLLALLVSALWLPAAAQADPQDRLAEARAQLVSLESELALRRDELAGVQMQLSSVNGLMVQGEEMYADLDERLDESRAAMAKTQARYDELQQRFGGLVRHAYMNNGAGAIAAIVGASDSGDLEERVTVMSELADHSLVLAEQATAMKRALQQQATETQTLIDQQQGALQQMRTQQQQITEESMRLQQAMDVVEETRQDLLDLAVRLKSQLQVADLDQLSEALKGKDSVSYGQWARLAAAQFKAPGCKENLIALIAWQANEGTDARWNPLATTYDMPGATDFNYIGVKNYVNLKQGLTASWLTLQRGWKAYGYGDIVISLRKCAKAEETAAAIAASYWCGCGSYYVVSLVDDVRRNFDFYSKI